jgi:hypothetical protein
VLPQVLLTEQLHAAAFGATSALGRPLFAPPACGAEELAAFVANLYVPANFTLVGSGLPHADLVQAATTLFGTSAGGGGEVAAASPFVGGASALPAQSALTHVALALPGAASGSPDFFTAQVLRQVLAAAAAPAGSLGAFSVSYADVGLVGLAGAAAGGGGGGGGAGALVAAMVALLKAPASDAAVAAAKLAVKTQLLVGSEDGAALVAALAAGGLNRGFAGVDAVTAAGVAALQTKMLAGGKVALATVGDASAVPAFNTVLKMF